MCFVARTTVRCASEKATGKFPLIPANFVVFYPTPPPFGRVVLQGSRSRGCRAPSPADRENFPHDQDDTGYPLGSANHDPLPVHPRRWIGLRGRHRVSQVLRPRKTGFGQRVLSVSPCWCFDSRSLVMAARDDSSPVPEGGGGGLR